MLFRAAQYEADKLAHEEAVRNGGVSAFPFHNVPCTLT
jgi:hypothetical protein